MFAKYVALTAENTKWEQTVVNSSVEIFLTKTCASHLKKGSCMSYFSDQQTAICFSSDLAPSGDSFLMTWATVLCPQILTI